MPQGGPLSPLLSNLLLDDLDKELERRGHRFVRYADDCNIYVKTERAGERVMEGMRTFLLPIPPTSRNPMLSPARIERRPASDAFSQRHRAQPFLA